MRKKVLFVTSLIIAVIMTCSMIAFGQEAGDAATPEAGAEAVAVEDNAEVAEAAEATDAETESAEDSETGIPDYINVVLFGLSADTPERDRNRTDSIIIVTFDNVHRQLKFTSILRDIKAEIEGYEPQKINGAYRLGGPELALNTLNTNFYLQLEDYITVNFAEYEHIIDSFGGVDIVLTQEEADYLNADGNLSEEERNLSAGLMHLNGIQTRQYSRIRKIDSDTYRSARQRKVLANLVEKVSEMEFTDFMLMAIDFLNTVEDTSLSIEDIAMIMSIPFDEYDIINNHFPDREKDKKVNGGKDENGQWVWTFKMKAAARRINDVIYNEQPVTGED